MFDIITFGSNTVDLFIKTDHREFKKGKDKIMAYPVGSKIMIENANFTIGGGGTNTAVSFSRLGLKTGYIGVVGSDHFGDDVISSLKKEKVSFLGLRTHALNGFSVILDSKEHNRTILAFKGSNNDLVFKNLNLKKTSSKWVYLSSMIGKSLLAQKKFCFFAKKNNVKVAFNPSSYLIKSCFKELFDILSFTDVLILNKEEALMLVKGGNLLKKLHSLGPSIVCITDGPNPVVVSDGSFVYTAYPHKTVPVEATGAGDAFGSSFVAGLILYDDIIFSLQIAIVNSESVINHHGAKNKLLCLKEILKKIKLNPVKIKKEVFK